MKIQLKKMLGTAAAAMLLAGPMYSHAASVTQNIALTGTIAPSPATCSFGAPLTLNFSGPASDWHEAMGQLSITCTSGLDYVITAPLAFNPIMIGSVPSRVLFYDVADFADGNNYVGTGSEQKIFVGSELISEEISPLDPKKHYGQVSGIVPFTVSF